MMTISDRLIKAIELSAIAHGEQKRKGSETPYITHPFAVALICQSYSDDEDLFIAALFHDVIEDVSPDVCSADDIEKIFGCKVLNIIKDVSEIKQKDGVKKSWKETKVDYINHLRDFASTEACVISAADKLYNIRATLTDYNKIGDKVWNRFHSTAAEQLWFYQSVLEILKLKLHDNVIVRELGVCVKDLEKIIIK